MEHQFSIRRATPAEADLLSNLALRSKAYWGYSASFIDACRQELTYSAEQIASDAFRFEVGEREGICVGFYALARPSGEDAELDALFVDPAYIGQGYGRLLMEHAKRSAASWGASRLTIQGDPYAERFYRAAGGTLEGWRESGSIQGRMLPWFVIELGKSVEPASEAASPSL